MPRTGPHISSVPDTPAQARHDAYLAEPAAPERFMSQGAMGGDEHVYVPTSQRTAYSTDDDATLGEWKKLPGGNSDPEGAVTSDWPSTGGWEQV